MKGSNSTVWLRIGWPIFMRIGRPIFMRIGRPILMRMRRSILMKIGMPMRIQSEEEGLLRLFVAQPNERERRESERASEREIERASERTVSFWISSM